MELKTGIYDGIPNAQYHGEVVGISNSYLKRLDKCPAAAKVPQEDSPAFLFGRAVHALVLEGETVFGEEFAVVPTYDKRTKEGKARFEEFEHVNAGKEMIKEIDFEVMLSIRDSIQAHPFASKILKLGKSEQTVIWTDATTGIQCKCRPDRIPSNGSGVLIDLKTCSDASEYGFGKSVASYGYAQQAAFYLDGFNAATGSDADAFIFIAVEKTAPFRVETYILDGEFLQYGRDQYQRLLFKEAECRANNSYPNYESPNLQTLYKPKYL